MGKTILIGLASYREAELLFTVKSFWESAAHPENLKFAIVSQDEDDKHPDLSFIPNDQLRYLKVNYKEVYGLTWARSITQHMFSSYDYYFQIDGHMFPKNKNWDIHLIEQHNKAVELHGEKVILSAYPPGYGFVDGERFAHPGGENTIADINGAIYRKTWANAKRIDVDLEQCYFIAGAYLFGTQQFIKDVPIDPEIDFFVDEIVWSLRTHARGYKIAALKEPIFYHCYAQERVAAGISHNIYGDGWKYMDTAESHDKADRFMRGEVHGRYGVTPEEIEAFCKETGYFTSHPGYDTGVPISH